MTWHERERARFASGEYKPPPWADEPWYAERGETLRLHFAHVSTDEPSKLAYTPDEHFGSEDRQLRVKPGKYLRKFFGSALPDAEIQAWTGRFTAENELGELLLARTPDEIERVYTEGPRSCMSGDSFESEAHPCRVYGAGDLAVAYAMNGDTISARTVCWPDKSITCGVIYGDRNRLEPTLEAAGYKVGSLSGAHLIAIQEPADSGRFVAPYMDGGYHATYTGYGLHLTLSTHGGMSLSSQSGLIGGTPCDRCNDQICEDDYHSMSGGNAVWCAACYESYGFYCESCEDCEDLENSVNIGDTYLCEGCARENAFKCERCDEWAMDEDGTEVNGDAWCQSCSDDHAFYCEHCETSCSTDNGTREVDSETWCSDCADSEFAFQCASCDEWSARENGRDYPRENPFACKRWCDDCADSRDAELDELIDDHLAEPALLPAHTLTWPTTLLTLTWRLKDAGAVHSYLAAYPEELMLVGAFRAEHIGVALTA